MWAAQNVYRSSHAVQPRCKQVGPDHHTLDLSSDVTVSFDTDALRETHRVIGAYLAKFPEELPWPKLERELGNAG